MRTGAVCHRTGHGQHGVVRMGAAAAFAQEVADAVLGGGKVGAAVVLRLAQVGVGLVEIHQAEAAIGAADVGHEAKARLIGLIVSHGAI